MQLNKLFLFREKGLNKWSLFRGHGLQGISLFALSLAFTPAGAQQVRPASSGKIYHEIAQLRNMVNVLYVAAHPDDENTRLLAYLVNDRNIRTAYLSLTRGDGGQNILGSEQGEALGLIRTHELIEARKLDGAEQYFSRAIDFGFSKTKEETFKHWSKEQLTSDAVWTMRKFRPDVVICRFPPDTLAGHGQHAASAVVAAAAFKASGDKTQYTDQLKYYAAWQPKRLLQNTYRFGSRNTTSEDQFKLPVGQYVPAMGMGVGELAGQSRSVHKSQGAGTPSVPGLQTEYFKLIGGDSLSTSLFDGIDITWGRVGRPDIGEDLENILQKFSFTHPDASIPALLVVRKKITGVKDEYWRKEKLEEIDQAILDCTGLMAEVYTKQPQTVAGASLPFTLHIIARSTVPVELAAISWGGADTTVRKRIANDTLLTFEHSITIPENTPVTQPYWLSSVHAEKDMFTIPDEQLLGLPETPAGLSVSVRLLIDGTEFNLKAPLSYKKLDPVKGDIVEQLRIVPGVTVGFNAGLLMAAADGSVTADVHLHAYTDVSNATLELSSYKAVMATVNNITMAAGADTIIPVRVQFAAGKSSYSLDATLSAGVNRYAKAQHLIQYNHLPVLQHFTASSVKVLTPDWKCKAKNIAYLEGAGDLVPSVLRQAGLNVDILKESDLTNAANLKKYDAVITGIRAVNVEKRMAYWLPVLLKYAENGGTLIMQYNTLQDMATTKLGPYPFTLSDKRVTEEDATITFADPKSRLLNYPNTITEKDFAGWVQERGLYFPVTWDEKYTPVFTMNDEGERPLSGSTLYTTWGKGHYIYTALSFSRQLPAGNKGAIRLLMNMMSVGK